MTEKVENLILEQLRHMRVQNDKILEEIKGLKVEMLAVRHHVRGVELLTDRHHDSIAELLARVDCIERRLELVDE